MLISNDDDDDDDDNVKANFQKCGNG